MTMHFSETPSPEYPDEDPSYSVPERSAHVEESYSLAEVHLSVFADNGHVKEFTLSRRAPGDNDWGSFNYDIKDTGLQQALYRSLTLSDTPQESAQYLLMLCSEERAKANEFTVSEREAHITATETQGISETPCIVAVQPQPVSPEDLVQGKNPYSVVVSRMAETSPFEELSIQVPNVSASRSAASVQLRSGSAAETYAIDIDSYQGDLSRYVFTLMELFHEKGVQGVSQHLNCSEEPEVAIDPYEEEDQEFEEGGLQEREISHKMNRDVEALMRGSSRTFELITGSFVKLVEHDTRLTFLLSPDESFCGPVMSVSVDRFNDYGGSAMQASLRGYFDVMQNERYQFDEALLGPFWDVVAHKAVLHPAVRYGDVMDRLCDEVVHEQEGVQWLQYSGYMHREDFRALYEGRACAAVEVPERSSHSPEFMKIELNEAGVGTIECVNQMGGSIVMELNPYDTHNGQLRFDRMQVALDILNTFIANPTALASYEMPGVFRYNSNIPDTDDEGVQWSLSTVGHAFDTLYGQGNGRMHLLRSSPTVTLEEDATVTVRLTKVSGTTLQLSLKDGTLQSVELQDRERAFRFERDVVMTDCENVDISTLLDTHIHAGGSVGNPARRCPAARYLRSCGEVSIETRHRWYSNVGDVFKSAFSSLFRRSR